MNICAKEIITAIIKDTFIEAFANSMCFFFRRYHALTLNTKKAPASQHPISTCVSLIIEEGLNTIAQKSVISALKPLGPMTISNPAGVCIHAFAMTIQTALKCAPRQTIIVLKK